MKYLCLAMIKFYRIYLSPMKPHVCRFYPTCSQYTYEAVYKYGVIKGLTMGAKRIIRCHPFNRGGYHPVE
ncbi:MAG: membrane protein insertion efficiency factor YidD [Bacillota bacterium]